MQTNIQTIERKRVSPVLQKLDINQSEPFSLSQLDTVTTTIDRLHAKTNKRFKCKRDKEHGIITVTRIEDHEYATKSN